jgi:hypothetical protein
MNIPTLTYGKIPVELWEYIAVLFLIVAFTLLGRQWVQLRIKSDPSWQFFLPGMWLKIAGGLMFGAIYTLYYKGGDTTSYYECGLAYVNLLYQDAGRFMTAMLGGGTPEIKSLFSAQTGYPMSYMFYDDKTRTVIKFCVPFMIVGGKSYFVTTVLLSLATYGGLWRLYRMFVNYFPKYYRNLSVAILFMPSLVFWGSGILKDSFTLAATCYFIVATNALINGNRRFWPVLSSIISGLAILAIKPYILLILFPGTLVWYFYKRIQRIRNAYFRYIMVPGIYAIIIAASYLTLTALGDRLGRFSPDRALQTAAIIQNDLKQDYYDGASFDIGTIEPTLWGVTSKFPAAVTAGLFRPYIWEARNVVMMLSGLENLFILLVTLYVLVVVRPRVTFELIKRNPLLLYCFVFAALFGFMIGVTTSNFGALVRFKIPLIPLYMGALAVLYSYVREHLSMPVRKRKRAVRKADHEARFTQQEW